LCLVTSSSIQAAENPATRAEVVRAIILARIRDIPVVRNTGEFIDIPYGHPDEAVLLYAERVGIIGATPQKQLLPYNSVNRAALIVMLARAYNLPTEPAIPFEDVAANSWYAPYAGIAKTYHFFALENDRRLEPEKLVTMTEVNHALLLVIALRGNTGEPVHIDTTQLRPSATPPSLSTVQSVRRQRVTLVDPPVTTRVPLVRRTPLTQPLSVGEKRTIILHMVNDIRREHGLQIVRRNLLLESSAQNYADRMVRENFFAHVSPDGQTLKQRIDVTGYTDKSFRPDCTCIPGYSLAENLAKGQKTAEEAVEDWMASPDHRAAILNPAYTHIGIGLNAGIWVQHFGGMVLP
jgi:uncharacterized protein YkwD